ncbi:hypothetical protein M407DRAFT_243638 [Tulasnella calospora MUT 4182]|uniref:Uncharacterized protein n=1 Tax=Tulasnella calospora MUT 4182 TaxID=1051891 RepID=A0A0C3QIG1_9AGAM|nr:hypothetical protein M407DRAFT_243638 [Tulasnella calospora MUT 4182]
MGSTRLYAKGRILSHKRGHRNTYPHITLLQIEGATSLKDGDFYVGKKVAYVYKAKTEKRGTKHRVIWGKITRTHGNSGIVRAKFKPNMPSNAFGSSCRIMLYPSRI